MQKTEPARLALSVAIAASCAANVAAANLQGERTIVPLVWSGPLLIQVRACVMECVRA